MYIFVDKYLDEVLKPQLRALTVSEAYIDEIYDVVSEQMNSALYHWQEMKNVFITLTKEEALFYEPEASLEVKVFVVLTLRNSPIETLQADSYKRAGLKQKISEEQLKEITTAAISYFKQIDLDMCFADKELPFEKDIYGYLKQSYIVAWRALEMISNSEKQSISFSSYRIKDSQTLLDAYRETDSVSTGDVRVVVDGYDITIDNTLYYRLKDIEVNKQVFFADCFKMVSRNIEKLFVVIEYLLANDAVFVTSNYLLGHTYAEKRKEVLKAASGKNPYEDICRHLADTSGLEKNHRRILSYIKI